MARASPPAAQGTRNSPPRATRIPAACDANPRREGHLQVVLLHDPGAFRHLPDGHGDLVLSGHTHGGQLGLLSLGLAWTIVRAATKIPDHGLRARGRDRLHMHRGTGHDGFPLRVGDPSEQSVLRVHWSERVPLSGSWPRRSELRSKTAPFEHARVVSALHFEPVRFDYYRRLSSEHKAIYRRSDEIKHIPLSNAPSLAAHVKELREALEAEREQHVRKSARALVDGITGMMGVERVHVIVRRQRPRNDWGELHGYYTMVEDRGAQIEVWMRTAANANVVAFRTFLRTLLHEVCHHLDLVWLRLDESFHTQGFFARESSLTRQLVGKGTPRPRRSAKNPTESSPSVRASEQVESPTPRQLSLF